MGSCYGFIYMSSFTLYLNDDTQYFLKYLTPSDVSLLIMGDRTAEIGISS